MKLVWNLQTSYRSKLNIVHECLPLIHRCQLLRNEMRCFVDTLLDYIFTDVVQVQWKRFEKKVRIS